jgi:hypothetical protein
MHLAEGAMAKKKKNDPLAVHGRFWSGTRAEQQRCYETLAERAGVALPEPKPTAEETIEANAQFWRSVAIALAAEKWPAFRLSAELTGKILDKTGAADWLASGGTRENMPTFFDDFYAAQFVVAIEGLRDTKIKRARAEYGGEETEETEAIIAKVRRRTRNEVFKSLEGNGPKAEREREQLPRPYRSRTTRKSLKEAYERISNEIQDHPEQYLPPKQPITPEGFLGEIPWPQMGREDHNG